MWGWVKVTLAEPITTAVAHAVIEGSSASLV